MRISAKGRYAIAASIYLAKYYNSGEYVTVISISEHLDISKIYLEQVFSLLKRGNVVDSIKGSQGGYRLTRSPENISVYDIFASIETALFEETKETVEKKNPIIEEVVQTYVYKPLDENLMEFLKSIPLSQLFEESEKLGNDGDYMYYI